MIECNHPKGGPFNPKSKQCCIATFNCSISVLSSIWQISKSNHPHVNFMSQIFFHVFSKDINYKVFTSDILQPIHCPHFSAYSKWTIPIIHDVPQFLQYIIAQCQVLHLDTCLFLPCFFHIWHKHLKMAMFGHIVIQKRKCIIHDTWWI